MKRFITDVKKFWNYSSYNVKAELKSEVVGVIFGASSKPYFLVFVFIGLNCWQFFNRVVRNSVKLVSNKKSIVTKVYIPKYMFILEKIGTNGFKMLVSFVITALFMVYYQVPLSFNMLWVVPLLIMLGIVAFAFSTIIMHFGVFVEDLLNIVTVGLQLVFYLSGIFYDITDRLAKNHSRLCALLTYGNPVALIMTDIRNSLLYNQAPHFAALGIWLAICLVISVIGIKIIYRYENSYVKII